MIALRKSEERGHGYHGWLDTRHTFSFADYYDPEQMGFSQLRVINEDRVAPGAGFPTHGHRDMEIISYVLSGALEHKDSLGNGSIIRPGDVQRMSAGTGVMHSEYNPSQTESVHFLQIWITPRVFGTQPGYEQKRFSDEERRGRLCLIVSPDGRDGSVTIQQDAFIYATQLPNSDPINYRSAPGRNVYIHLARGVAAINERALTAGDGARITQEAGITLVGEKEAELLIFDLP